MNFYIKLKVLLLILLYLIIIHNVSWGQTWQERPEPTFEGLSKDSIYFRISSNDIFIRFGEEKLNLIATLSIYQLKDNGIKVTTDDINGYINYPHFHISIQLEPITINSALIGYAFSVSVLLRQKVILERNKRISDYATTWERTKTSFAPSSELMDSILRVIKDKINEFIIEYWKAKT